MPRSDQLLDSAVDMLRSIAAMGKKAGSESAKNWLLGHGYALEEGGYIPGRGFERLETGRPICMEELPAVEDSTHQGYSDVNGNSGCADPTTHIAVPGRGEDGEDRNLSKQGARANRRALEEPTLTKHIRELLRRARMGFVTHLCSAGVPYGSEQDPAITCLACEIDKVLMAPFESEEP